MHLRWEIHDLKESAIEIALEAPLLSWFILLGYAAFDARAGMIINFKYLLLFRKDCFIHRSPCGSPFPFEMKQAIPLEQVRNDA